MGAEGFIYELIIIMEVDMKKYKMFIIYFITLFFITSGIVLITWGKPKTLSIYDKTIEVIKIQW